MIKADDKNFLRQAIVISDQSRQHGHFPAGAIVVMGDQVLSGSESLSDIDHAESTAIDQAYRKNGKLTEATLYASMEPCLMCLMRAYWSGIRRVVYAVPRARAADVYEGRHDNPEIIKKLFESIEYLSVDELAPEAFNVVESWKTSLS